MADDESGLGSIIAVGAGSSTAKTTQDVGNGVKLVNIGGIIQSAQSAQLRSLQVQNLKNRIAIAPLEQEEKQLGLVKLSQDIQTGALEQELKKQQTQINSNTIAMLPVANAKAMADLVQTQGQERRAQMTFQADQLKSIHEAYAQSPTLGQAVQQAVFPGSMSVINKDGTVSGTLLVNGRPTSFTIDPQLVASPEKRLEIEQKRREDFVKAGQTYSVLSGQYQNMEKLAPLASAEGDIGMIFSYMKLLDPNSAVREGEQLTARNAPGIDERLRNLYNRALTEKAPIFGPAGSDTRKNFLDASKSIYQTARDNFTSLAQHTADAALRDRLNPANVLMPVGDFRPEEILGSEKKVAGTQGTETGRQPQQSQPAALPTPGAGANSTPIKPSFHFEQLMRQNLFLR